MEPIIKHLPCQLTRDEHIDRARQQGRTIRETLTLKAEAKAAAADASARVKELEQTITDLGRVLESGKEYRPVECYDSVNRVAKIVETRRRDTGEVVCTRSLTPSEEQIAFDELTGTLDGMDDHGRRANSHNE